jgi:hypothetical protein
MTSSVKIEQALLAKLRELPLDQQQEVLDFAEFLYQKIATTQNLSAKTEGWNTAQTKSLAQRHAFIKLPLEERRQHLGRTSRGNGSLLSAGYRVAGTFAR